MAKNENDVRISKGFFLKDLLKTVEFTQ